MRGLEFFAGTNSPWCDLSCSTVTLNIPAVLVSEFHVALIGQGQRNDSVCAARISCFDHLAMAVTCLIGDWRSWEI